MYVCVCVCVYLEMNVSVLQLHVILYDHITHSSFLADIWLRFADLNVAPCPMSNIRRLVAATCVVSVQPFVAVCSLNLELLLNKTEKP